MVVAAAVWEAWTMSRWNEVPSLCHMHSAIPISMDKTEFTAHSVQLLSCKKEISGREPQGDWCQD
jgi:hypothetical protein